MICVMYIQKRLYRLMPFRAKRKAHDFLAQQRKHSPRTHRRDSKDPRPYVPAPAVHGLDGLAEAFLVVGEEGLVAEVERQGGGAVSVAHQGRPPRQRDQRAVDDVYLVVYLALDLDHELGLVVGRVRKHVIAQEC